MDDHTRPSTPSDFDGQAPQILPAAVDLRHIDPARNGPGFDAIVRSIATEAIAARAASRRAGVLAPVVAWTRPTLAAAAVVLIVAGSALAFLPRPAVAGPASFAESAGVPTQLMDLVSSAKSPSADELVAAVNALPDLHSGH